MATRGSKPKPTKLKLLEGNPGKRQLNTNEPMPHTQAPECPDWLLDEAKTEWARMSKQLEQLVPLYPPRESPLRHCLSAVQN